MLMKKESRRIPFSEKRNTAVGRTTKNRPPAVSDGRRPGFQTPTAFSARKTILTPSRTLSST